MNITTEFDVLHLVCNKLDQAQISYMLTGSFASNYYAEPRMTRDIDIVIALSVGDADRICALFRDDFYLEQEAIAEAVKRKEMFNIIHNGTVIKIDFIVRKDAEYRKTEFERRQKVDYNGIPLWIVAAEDLVISKLFWAKESGSELQLQDVQNILDSVESIDHEYLDSWVKRLQLQPIFQKVEE